MSENALRFGIVGCEGIGETHAQGVERADGADLVACADLDEAVATTFVEEHDLDGRYRDVGGMVVDADLDAVCICTPSGTHADLAVEAAEAGANVLCEKPLDVTLEGMDAMIEAADDHGVTLGGVFQRRTHAENQRAKRAIEDGELGTLVVADARVRWWRTQAYYDSGEWRGTREFDGGCLMNQAVHGIDLLCWFAGPIERVSAMTDTVGHDMEMEDVATVAVAFESGAYGAIEATTGVRGGRSGVEVCGTDGSYDSGGFDSTENAFDLAEGEIVVSEDREWGDGHARQIQDFVDALHEGREPMVTGREARTAVEVILAAYASASLDRPVRPDELRGLTEHT